MNTQTFRRWYLIVFSIIFLSMTVYVTFFETFDYFSYAAFIFTGLGAVISMTFRCSASDLQIKKSIHVAIVGFSRSGKTTLITSLFGEGFRKNLPINLEPRGSKTIDKINLSLEMLNKGKALGPTQDQDMFSFRADATTGSYFARSTYRVEFGDFPGAYTEKTSEEKDNNKIKWLHNSEFFRWIADSDAIIFVVDLGKYLSN